MRADVADGESGSVREERKVSVALPTILMQLCQSFANQSIKAEAAYKSASFNDLAELPSFRLAMFKRARLPHVGGETKRERLAEFKRAKKLKMPTMIRQFDIGKIIMSGEKA